MLAKVDSATIVGIEAHPVCIEVHVGLGLPGFHVVGLGAGAAHECAVRIKAALAHGGWKLPARKITINLAPADLRKEGASFDLPIAMGILAAQGVVPIDALSGVLMLGEVALDGVLRPVAGGLPVALLARRSSARVLILPVRSAGEAALVSGSPVLQAATLADVVAFLTGQTPLAPPLSCASTAASSDDLDLLDVRGLAHARLALEIAAAGGHSLLLIGPPGSGKSMLARRLPTILPPLDEEEALETSLVYSAAQLLDGSRLVERRPFRSPHHGISQAGLVGGGSVPRPGEISLAHNGVLFLDELLEFQRAVLDSLRQPLEERTVSIARARMSVRFPASFALVAAMNPCPCGYAGSSVRACVCDVGLVRRYRARLSGPLADRLDLQVHVPRLTFDQLEQQSAGESSARVQARVLAARARQRARLCGTKLHANAELGVRELRRHCALDAPTLGVLGALVERRQLSARSTHRLLRVARTIADLDGRERISRPDVLTASTLRALDGEN